MNQVYELISFGVSPVTLADMKTFLKITNTAEDTLLQTFIDSATQWGEKYTGREFRANQWELLLDSFSDFGNSSKQFHVEYEGISLFQAAIETERIELKRDPVDIVNSITHLIDAAPVTVTNTDYYLKKLTQSSEILLFDDKDWPTDTDDREQAIKVTFTTKAYRCLSEIINAIKLHVSNLYTNRGDCPDSDNSGKESGATMFYDQFRIQRI